MILLLPVLFFSGCEDPEVAQKKEGEVSERILEDIPAVSNRGREIDGFFVGIDLAGRVFLRGESGVVEKLSDDEFLQRILLFDSVAKTAKQGPCVFQVSVHPETTYQRFAEVLGLFEKIHSTVSVIDRPDDFFDAVDQETPPRKPISLGDF